MTDIGAMIGDHKNFVFIGEAGSGKSVIALNFALWLQAMDSGRGCHFFDMDMTKPLFRSRDMRHLLEDAGVLMHYQEQFMDAPTLVGGVRPMLKKTDVYTLLDVGGDYIGARAIGGFQAELNRGDTMVFYVLNAFRPWTDTIEHIDGTMSRILGVSHIDFNQIHLVNNTNRGPETSAEDFISGSKKLEAILSSHAMFAFSTVQKHLYHQVRHQLTSPVYPIDLLLRDPWEGCD